jgi:hypothetical protein
MIAYPQEDDSGRANTLIPGKNAFAEPSLLKIASFVRNCGPRPVIAFSITHVTSK